MTGSSRNRRRTPMSPAIRFAAVRVPLAVVAIAASLLVVDADAATQSARRDPSRADGDRILTPAQIKACLAKKDSLHLQVDQALGHKAQIEAEKAEITRTGASLADEVATLDRTQVEAVAAYNAKVVRRDEMIDAYEARVTVYNTEAEGVKSTQDDYQKSCENRRYDERDLIDVKRKKK